MFLRILRTCAVLAIATPLASSQVSTFPYFEDFEASPGGYLPGGSNPSWEWGAPTGPFIGSAAGGIQAWVTNLDGTYNQNEVSYLLSPTFDLTGMGSDPTLQFSHIFEHDISDESWVEISIFGGPFTKLGTAGVPGSFNWYNDAFNDWWDGDTSPPGAWRLARYKMTGTAGTTIQLRWFLNGDNFVGEDGIGIDDVAVFETLKDVGVASIDSPVSGAFLSSSEIISASITNVGTTTESGFRVSYTVSGPVSATATEMFGATVPPLTTVPFSFATPVDLSAPGTYTIEVRTILDGDQVPTNDLAMATVVNQAPVTVFPYLEDFESGNGDFVEGGTSSSWQHGAPSGNLISGAASGVEAWVTNLSGFYNPIETSYLQSPPFVLAGMDNDPFLRFSHLYNIDFSDESWVEVSIDGGAFSKLGKAGDPASLNWYNDTGNDWWDGTSQPTGQWRKAQHIIPGAAGKTVVVRWIFRSNNTFSLNEEGVGVDDVEIYEAPFNNGQAPQPGLAVMDINDALEAVGFPVSSGQPGPYFSVANATGTLDMHFEGPPNQAIVLLGGDLFVGARIFPFGQLDVQPYTIYASGLNPGGLNQLFFTNNQGVMDLSITVPLAFVGKVITFQSAIVNPVQNFALSNAVQVTFLP